MGRETESDSERGLRLRTWIALAGFLAVAVFFLWEEHRAHLLGALPLLLFALACMFLHLFMHGGHGGGHGGPGAGENRGGGRG